jgi:endonuclease/exonuclease/phosphatase (EEP) superfamily protein YafD
LLGTQDTGNAILIAKNIPQPDIFDTVRFRYQRQDFLNIARPRGYQKLSWSHFNTTIINTHLNHINDNQPQIQELLLSLHHLDQCMILGGDFNTENVTALINNNLLHVTKKVGYTFRQENPYNFWKSHSVQIDHIFTSGVPSYACRVEKRWFESDHDAVYMEIIP